jgi:hypothetical protein
MFCELLFVAGKDLLPLDIMLKTRRSGGKRIPDDNILENPMLAVVPQNLLANILIYNNVSTPAISL